MGVPSCWYVGVERTGELQPSGCGRLRSRWSRMDSRARPPAGSGCRCRRRTYQVQAATGSATDLLILLSVR